MKRLSLILSGVLVLQLALAGLLTLSGPDSSASKGDEPLVAFAPDKVDHIVISQSGGGSVALEKQDSRWIVPSLAGFPADQQLVDSFVDKIAGLKKGWPMATTTEAARRFKVADDAHERRIILKNGDKAVATVLLGTAPTYRQTHIRAGGSDEIFSAALSAHEAGTSGAEWMDRGFLNVPQDKVASIAIGDLVLERKDGKFTLAGLKDGEKLNSAEVPPIVSAIVTPAFDTVQGKGEKAVAKAESADITVTLKRQEGEPITYKYKKEESGGAYLFASSEHPYLFRVAEASVKPIADAKREKLVQKQTAQKKKEAEEPAVTGSGVVPNR